MKLNLPRKIRALLYVITIVGSPIMTYLLSLGLIGDLEMSLWSSEVAVVATIAGLNLTPSEE